MADVEVGKTYIGVICRKCDKPTPFVEVEPGTTLGRTEGEFEIECVSCGYKAAYPAHEFRTMEVHQIH